MFADCVNFCVLLLCIFHTFSSATAENSSGECCQRKVWMDYINVATEMINKARKNTMTKDTIDECGEEETAQVFMDVAIDMMDKLKIALPYCNTNINTCINSSSQVLDCADLLLMGYKRSGVYTVSPTNWLKQNNMSLRVYCDMETDGGGWTVIQRRGNFGNPSDYFFKDWNSYKKGFGDIEKEFWLGNDNIFALTNQRLYSVRFDLMDDLNETRFAHYKTFWIDDENDRYTLHISGYTGDAGDSMTVDHDNRPFFTKDKTDDYLECAPTYKGAWWYGSGQCHQANLNGLNMKNTVVAEGINWYTWKGYHESLAWTEMKIRPKSFRP